MQKGAVMELKRHAVVFKAALISVAVVSVWLVVSEFLPPHDQSGGEDGPSDHAIKVLLFIALGIAPPPPRFRPGPSSSFTQPGDRATVPKVGESPSIAKPLLVMLALMAAISATGVQLYLHQDREPREDAHHGPRTVC